jgi:hypothetical protein
MLASALAVVLALALTDTPPAETRNPAAVEPSPGPEASEMEQRYDRIQAGMTLAEAEATMGEKATPGDQFIPSQRNYEPAQFFSWSNDEGFGFVEIRGGRVYAAYPFVNRRWLADEMWSQQVAH